MKITDQMRATLDALGLIPRTDALEAECSRVLLREGKDSSLAPIWAEKLRHTYAKVVEQKFPQYAAANGDVLPVDSSVDPASLEWEYFMIESAGYADWIDDDGAVAPSSAIKASRHTGKLAEMGHRWDMTVFDLERAAKANVPLAPIKQKHAKRTHDAKTNWVWLFGDSAKDLPGLCNHPNIGVSQAPDGTLGGGGGTAALADMTNDEILSVFASLINSVAEDTLENYHAATVWMSHADYRTLRDRRLGAGDGFASLLGLLTDRYKGDESGQGKVTFRTLLECDKTRRTNPKTGVDNSGIARSFLLAIPQAGADELAFIRARPYTQRPPQERDMVMHHMTHSKIGGCKCQIPLAVQRMDLA